RPRACGQPGGVALHAPSRLQVGGARRDLRRARARPGGSRAATHALSLRLRRRHPVVRRVRDPAGDGYAPPMPVPPPPPPPPPPAGPPLPPARLGRLAALGGERPADVGDVLYRVGDRSYPFIAIREGEVAIVDAAGHEIVRHGPAGFLGELNLLSGQTVFVTAVVMQALRYVAVDRAALRELLFEDGPLSDLLLSTFIARREALEAVDAIGLDLIGPPSSPATLAIVEFARSNRLPLTWRDPGRDPAAAELIAGLDEASLPLVRLPGDLELRGPSTGEALRALGI